MGVSVKRMAMEGNLVLPLAQFNRDGGTGNA